MHFATLVSPLGEDTLILSRMTGHEALGRLFSYELELLSLDGDIVLADLIGQTMTVKLEVASGGIEDATRHFHGYVAQFARVGVVGRYVVYHAVLRPWFWLLTRSSDCRIFQGKTVPDVIEQVFRDHGMTDFERSLSRRSPYSQWEYIVQYRESAFNFVSRLMEQEGIYYYFKHEEDKHILVMADSYSAHQTVPGYEEVTYYPPQSSERREHDHLDDWHVTQQLQPGSFMLNDFDFKIPKAGLRARLAAPKNKGEFEMYDYPGEYVKLNDGEDYARVRLEELTARYEGAEANGNARGLGIGHLFKLAGFPRADQNREYLVTGGVYHLDLGIHESGPGVGEDPTYRCALRVLESQTPFRPARETRQPTIAGPQTAIVVGPSEQEIWTDEYGRVKLHFHWDRHDKSNEDSSCWVRVAQYWAGARWGSIHVPRIGQEVIVEFLEGDPDRPIITGRVYNADNMPPYELGKNATQSGWKSRSTKGGNPDNFNEMRFEDLKGEEQLFIQAERNMDTLVKNNETLTVKANRTKSISGNENNSIGGDRSKTVTGKETNTIVKTRTTDVTDDETQTFHANRTTTVHVKDSLHVETGVRAETFDSGRTTDIKKFDNLTVFSANKNTTVHGQFNNTADEHFKVQQKASQLFIKDKVFIETNGDIELKNGGTHYTGGQGGKLSLTVNDEITITCGAAKISMKKDGTIQITGTTVKIGTPTNNAAYEPAGITNSGVKISSSAIGIHEVQGALVKIG